MALAAAKKQEMMTTEYFMLRLMFRWRRKGEL
jgi:hypothetical protein